MSQQLDSPAQLFQTALCGILGSAPENKQVIPSKLIEQEKRWN